METRSKLIPLVPLNKHDKKHEEDQKGATRMAMQNVLAETQAKLDKQTEIHIPNLEKEYA